MHALMKDGHDPDRPIAQHLPIDDVSLVTAEIAVDAKLRRDLAPWELAPRNRLEPVEHASEVERGLIFPPPVSGIAIDLIQPIPRACLDPEIRHTLFRVFLWM